jgi:hypothetical protein
MLYVPAALDEHLTFCAFCDSSARRSVLLNRCFLQQVKIIPQHTLEYGFTDLQQRLINISATTNQSNKTTR